MAAVELNIEGLDELNKKLKQLSNPKKAKQIARKAGRQAMNLVRDAARSNAKAIDDPETREKIHKNINTLGITHNCQLTIKCPSRKRGNLNK